MINTVATSLLHAGLPAQYWPFALNCVVHNLNIEDVEGDGDSAWKRMTGEDFKGKAIPFGAKVFSKLTDAREKTYAVKFDPKRIPGIFAGYIITSGQNWSRKYRVWDMAEFAHVNLSMNAAVPRRMAQPYATEVVVLPQEIVFPLKAEYERMNATIEGLKRNADLQGKELKDDADDHPPHDGGDEDDDNGPPKGKPLEHEQLEDMSEYIPGEEEKDVPADEGYDRKILDAILVMRFLIEPDVMKVQTNTTSSTVPPEGDARGDHLGHDDVGPPGRLIPKVDEEDPSAILARLRDLKLVERCPQKVMSILCDLPDGPHDNEKEYRRKVLAKANGRHREDSRRQNVIKQAIQFAAGNMRPQEENRVERSAVVRTRPRPACLATVPACLSRWTRCFSVFKSSSKCQRTAPQRNSPSEVPSEVIANALEAATATTSANANIPDEEEDGAMTVGEPEMEVDDAVDMTDEAEPDKEQQDEYDENENQDEVVLQENTHLTDLVLTQARVATQVPYYPHAPPARCIDIKAVALTHMA